MTRRFFLSACATVAAGCRAVWFLRNGSEIHFGPVERYNRDPITPRFEFRLPQAFTLHDIQWCLDRTAIDHGRRLVSATFGSFADRRRHLALVDVDMRARGKGHSFIRQLPGREWLPIHVDERLGVGILKFEVR